jgi:hypothetical protein
MPKKPTAADAELILKLYDLRREAEIRKARNWWLVDFWPENIDEFMKVAQALGTQENAWLRQVIGYWDLTASLLVHGAANETLFMEPTFSGEMFLIFAKLHPFLKEIREKMNPGLLKNVEAVIKKSKASRERLVFVEQRLAARRKQMKEAAGRM